MYNSHVREKKFWRDKFQHLKEQVDASDRSIDFVKKPAAKYFDNSLPPDVCGKLLRICGDSRSLLVMLTASLYVFLTRRLGKETLCLQTTIEKGFDHNEHVNTILPLLTDVDQSRTFREILDCTKKVYLEAAENQHYPIKMMIDALFGEGLKEVKLFDAAIFMTDDQSGQFATQDLMADVAFQFINREDSLASVVYYNPDTFSDDDIKSFMRGYNTIVENCLAEPDKRISDIGLLSREEMRFVLDDFNQTKTNFPANESIYTCFGECVKNFPDKIAIVHNDHQVTYRELDALVSALAGLLRDHNILVNTPVAIFQNISVHYVVSILAVLKAGGLYVPIAPEYPQERIGYLLKDSGTEIILTSSASQDLLINIDGCKKIIVDNAVLHAAPLEVQQPFDLAYMMFTSGSTGLPKGTLITHKNVLRLVKNTEYVRFSAATRIMLTGAVTFDATTFEIWGSLLNGGQLTLIDKDNLLDLQKFEDTLRRNSINTLWLTSPFFNQIVEQDEHNVFADLWYLVVGGDALSPSHIERVRLKNESLEIVNGYGPTENTTFSLTMPVKKSYDRTIPIGKPISNSTAYVLGEKLDVQPVSSWGILYVGGEGVMRGYLNNPELTHAKLVENPFGAGRLYKTDDIVRMLPEGTIEFKGRADKQIKIRGFRIEPGEIEQHILQYPGIKNCIVTAYADDRSEKKLFGYFVAAQETNEYDLRAFLTKKLPSYMIPVGFIQLEKFPLTSNGKIDMKSLPTPGERQQATGDWLNTHEHSLAQIWAGVLGIAEGNVTRSSHFFELGGHSLTAASLLNRIQKKFQVKLSIQQLFKHPRLEALASLLAESASIKSGLLKRVEKKEYYELSPAQKRIYVLQQLIPESTAYNIVTSNAMNGKIDAEELNSIFQKLIERHESLRTSFITWKNRVYQQIVPDVDFSIEEIDCSDEARLPLVIKAFIKPFDLTKPPLMRAAIIKTAAEKNILLLDMHHSIADAGSQQILLEEYELLRTGKKLSASIFDYKDIAAWQQKEQESASFKKKKDYWLHEFQGDIPLLNLPVDFERPKIKKYDGDFVDFRISEELSNLRSICAETTATLNMLLLSAWTITLSKYTCQSDLVVGMPVAGRTYPGLEQVVGMFVNTLPVRCTPLPHISFKEYLFMLRGKVLSAIENQDFPMEDMVDLLVPVRDTARNPLFDVSFNFLQSKGTIEEYHSAQLEEKYQHRVSKFDLCLNAVEFENGIQVRLEYASAIFRKETVERLVASFNKVLRRISENRNVLLRDVDVLDDLEKKQIIFTFNDTQRAFPGHQRIDQLLEEVSVKFPDRVALFDGLGNLTYKALAEKAGLLAKRFLQHAGFTKGKVIGLSMTSRKEMVIGMLGILKSGNAFLPFDPQLPTDRIRQMMDAAEVNLIVTEQRCVQLLEFVRPLISVDDVVAIEQNELLKNDGDNGGADATAYIIYTSGTTGVPNGVPITHRSLVNLCEWHSDYYAVTRFDRATKYASLSFDASVWEIFPYLYSGASVYFVKDEDRYEVQNLNSSFERNGITITFLPTQIGEKFSLLKNNSLKALLVGGDRLKQVIGNKNQYDVYNNYGPTENTVVTTACRLNSQNTNVSIGKPIANTQVYILNPESLELVPLRVAGELCVAGESLSRGYLNNADLTGKRFIENPFKVGDRLYRTGDLARWLPDGNIEFIGRTNDQIKIRGYRVELGEIESVLATIQPVNECVVRHFASDTGNFLCAYYTSAERIPTEILRRHLSSRLPEYMIPLSFVRLENMPLTHNGKIDLRALPAPVIESTTTYAAATNDTQKALVRIWSDVLAREPQKIGIDDNFFELGGNSIKSIQVKERIFESLGTDIPVISLFEYTSIRLLTEFIEHGAVNRANEVQKMKLKEEESLDILQETLQNFNF